MKKRKSKWKRGPDHDKLDGWDCSKCDLLKLDCPKLVVRKRIKDEL